MKRSRRLFPIRFLLMLLAALGVLFAPVAEAAECLTEDVSAAVALADVQAGDDADPGTAHDDKNASCAHGHCHHGSTALGRSPALDAEVFSKSARLAARVAQLVSIERDLPRRPPRA